MQVGGCAQILNFQPDYVFMPRLELLNLGAVVNDLAAWLLEQGGQ